MHSRTLRHCDTEWAERSIASGDGRSGGAEGLLLLPHGADIWSPAALEPGWTPGPHYPAARLRTQGPYACSDTNTGQMVRVNKHIHLVIFNMLCGRQVRGLCGTLTWNQHDDFTTPEGDVETSVSSFAAKFTAERCTLPAGGLAPQDPCTTYTQRRHYAHSVCSIIHSSVFQVRALCGCMLKGVCLFVESQSTHG